MESNQGQKNHNLLCYLYTIYHILQIGCPWRNRTSTMGIKIPSTAFIRRDIKTVIIRNLLRMLESNQPKSEYESLAKPICESALNGGECPIWTDGRLQTLACFQDKCIRPLCQLSIKFFFKCQRTITELIIHQLDNDVNTSFNFFSIRSLAEILTVIYPLFLASSSF